MELTSATLPGIALTLIHTGRAPTRSALTSQLGVTRATIGAITGELRDLGLIVVDAGPGQWITGRRAAGPALAPPAARPFRPGGARGPGAPGRLRRRACRAWRDRRRAPRRERAGARGPRAALAPVAAAAAALLRESGRRCVGAAVAVPTAVTRPEGTAVRALYVGWPDGAPVRDIFAAELARHGVRGPRGGPVGCDAVNDVNALALAEHRHGAGRDATHLLVVSAEHRGVGGALVQRGALYTGSGGLAMEAGHVSVDPGGRLCLCGNRGCLSVEADVERFLGEAGRPASAGTPALDEAVAVLRAGYPADQRVRAAADAIAARLGLGLAGLINVVNPDRVLLGGMYRELLAVAPERLREAVARRSPWGHGAGVPIERCELDDAGLIGAAEVAWQPVLDNPALLRGE